MRCWRCKSEMPEGLKYCGNCGVHMNRTVYLFQWLFSKKGLPVVIGVLVLALVVAGMLLWPGRDDEERLSVEMSETLIRDEFVAILAYDENQDNPFMGALLEGFEVHVSTLSETDNGFVAECTLSNYDVIHAFAAMETQTMEMTWKEYAELISEHLKTVGKVEMETEMLIVSLEEGVYCAKFTEEQIDAALGYLITYYNQLLSEGGA